MWLVFDGEDLPSPIQALLSPDGELFFLSKDISKLLNYKNVRQFCNLYSDHRVVDFFRKYPISDEMANIQLMSEERVLNVMETFREGTLLTVEQLVDIYQNPQRLVSYSKPIWNFDVKRPNFVNISRAIHHNSGVQLNVRDFLLHYVKLVRRFYKRCLHTSVLPIETIVDEPQYSSIEDSEDEYSRSPFYDNGVNTIQNIYMHGQSYIDLSEENSIVHVQTTSPMQNVPKEILVSFGNCITPTIYKMK